MYELITATYGYVLAGLYGAAIIRVSIESLTSATNLLSNHAGLGLAVLGKQSVLGVITAALAVPEQEYYRLITLYLCKYIGYIVETYIGIGGLSVQSHCAAQEYCGCHKHYLFHFGLVLV
jgi:hypothetical protein